MPPPGCIADDFTGVTHPASALVRQGIVGGADAFAVRPAHQARTR